MNSPITGRTLRHSLYAVAALICCIAITGCSAPKQAQKKAPHTTVIPDEIAQQTPQQRYEQLCASYHDWQDVSMPVKISLTSPKSVRFSARATMKRNRWVHFSVRLLGFELASVWIDNDSVHAIDKYHKRYLSESISKIFAGADFTIGDVQNLLLGRGFIAGKNGGTFTQPMEPSLSLTPSDDGLIILPTEQNTAFEYGFLLYPDANQLLAASVSVGDTHAGVATYTGFTPTVAGSFAASADLSIVKGRKASANVEWNLSAAKWNTGENRTWQSPKGYKRIDAAGLLKSLTSM